MSPPRKQVPRLATFALTTALALGRPSLPLVHASVLPPLPPAIRDEKSAVEPRLVHEGEPPRPPPEPRAPREDYLGVIVARDSADIAPRFEGRLLKVNVRVGDRVTAGTVLAKLTVPTLKYDIRVAQAEVSAATLDIDRASAELSQAGERFDRRRKLDMVQLATADEMSSADYQARLANNMVRSARVAATERRARLERLQKDLHDTEIIAPFDGVIAARYADPGATVRSFSPIVRIITLDDLLVRFAVVQAAVSELPVGSRVVVRTNESRRTLSATVERIAAEVEPASHMVFVEAKVDPTAPGNEILSGEFARVSLPTDAQ